MNLSAASSLNKIIIAQNCSAVMTVFDLDTPHLNSGSRSEFSGATKPNSSWSQTQLTRPIVALVEAGWLFAAIIYQDWATYGRAMHALSEDAAYQRLYAEALKIGELQERSVIVTQEL